MFGAFTAGWFVGLSAAVVAGTAFLLVMETSMRAGVRVALPAGAGVATGDAAWAAVVAAAGTTLHRLLAPWTAVLHWVAVAVVLALWVFAVRQLVRSEAAAQPDTLPSAPARAYLEFLAFTVVDAVTVVFFLSIIIGAAPSYRATDAAAFVAGAFLASLSWQTAAVVVGRRRPTLTARARRIVLAVDIVLLTMFIGYIAFGLYRP